MNIALVQILCMEKLVKGEGKVPEKKKESTQIRV
jgi:hypothetical protein